MTNELAKKVPLELLCLYLLEERDMYGYEMAQELTRRSDGRINVKLTTLYMALKRLEEKGSVTVRYSNSRDTRERARLYYHMEPSAKAYQQDLLKEYENLVKGVQIFLDRPLGKNRT